MSPPYVVAVLTVSDTAAAKGASYDPAGLKLRELVEAHASYSVGPSAIVPDRVAGASDEAGQHELDKVLQRWCDGEEGRVDWIIVTGGTGWSPRDRTPEAAIFTPPPDGHFTPLPILAHHLSTEFLAATPLSVLSRPIVGMYDQRILITALPGSTKACAEAWTALTSGKMQGVLEHGLGVMRGKDAEGKGAAMHPPREEVRVGGTGAAQEAGQASGESHQHDHHHHHNHHHHGHGAGHGHQAPMARSRRPGHAVSERLRQSPYPLISLSEALQLVSARSSPLPVVSRRVDHTLHHHVLAEDVFARHPIPATRTTNVDGYAVVAATTKEGVYKVRTGLEDERCVVRVNTGGPLPAGADAVVMVEDTEIKSKTADGGEDEVEILAAVPAGENVRQPGSDAKEGEKVLEKGTIIGPGGGEVGLLGFVGQKEVKVYKRPVIAILSTGNELVDLHAAAAATSSAASGWTGVVDTNRPSLRAALEGMGYEVVDAGIARDQLQEQQAAFEAALEKADVVITTGGTSMGEADLVKPIIEHQLGGTIHFGRVAMKPGKPTTFATIPHSDGSSKHVFALPGNPASALVTLYLFVVPLLRSLGGWPTYRQHLPRIQVKLAQDMPIDPREEFHRVVIEASSTSPGILVARSTGGQRSSRVASLSGANGFVHLPARTAEGPRVIKQGEMATAVVIGELLVTA